MDNIGFNPDNIDQTFEPKQQKKPGFLIFLIILSATFIVFGLFGTLGSFAKGPLAEDELEEGMTQIYESISQLEAQGMSDFTGMLQMIIDYSTYINNNAFYLSSILTLLTYIVGIVSIVMMFQLRKIGFHLYVLYSLLPVITMYITAPAAIIPNIYIVFFMALAVLFCLLYALNLKYMK